MGISKKQKKYIKDQIKRKNLADISKEINISKEEIKNYLLKIWGKQKYQKVVSKDANGQTFKSRVKSFDFKSWFKKSGYVIPLLIFLVLLAYTNSLNNDFLSDDIAGIVENPNIGNISRIFTSPLSTLLFFRPLLYTIAYKIFGLSAIAFRLPNVFFHLGSVFCVYFICYFLFNKTVALFSSAIVAVHPIMIESIVWISGGGYVQYSFFVLCSILFYILSIKNNKLLYFSFGLGAFSLTTSEKGIIFPIVLLGLDYIYKINNIKKWKKLAPLGLIVLVIAIFLLSKIPERISVLQSSFYQKPTITNPLLYLPVSITSYFELIFWPKALTLYHTELNTSSFEFYLRVVLLVSYLVAAFYFFKKNKSVFYWLAFFLVCLTPTLTPFGVSWFVAERYVYLSAIGIFIVFSYFLSLLYKNPKYKTFTLGIFLIMITALTVRTISRNSDWKNQDTLWLATAKTSPSSHQNHNNLGDMYGRHGDLDKAEEEFKKSIDLKPNFADAYHNLANIYLQKQETDKAIENYQKAAEINPSLWQSYSNLSGIYFQQENYQKAEEYIKQAIEANPSISMSYYNLAATYYKMENFDEVIPLLNKALEIDPENQQAKEFLNSIQATQ